MTQADAYNSAFRSHHLIRFYGVHPLCWAHLHGGTRLGTLIYMGERVLDSKRAPKTLSRALQEASKRVPQGFRVEDTIRTPFWTHFRGSKKGAWDVKNH